MLSILKIEFVGSIKSKESPKEFYFPEGVKKLDELMYRTLEVIKPELPKDWNSLFISRNESGDLKIILDQDKEIEPGIYSKGYLNVLMGEILEKAEGNPKVIELYYTNANLKNNMSFDVRVK